MRFTIKLKLVLAFGLLIILMTGSTLFGVSELGKLNAAQSQMIVGPMAQLQRAQSLSIGLLQISRAQKNMALANDAQELQSQNAKADKQRQGLEDALAQGVSNAASPESKAKWTALRSDWEGYANSDTVMRKLLMDNRRAEAVTMMQTSQRQITNGITDRVDDLVDFNQQALKSTDEAGNQAYATARNMLIGVVVVSLLIAAAAAAWIAISISRGLSKVMALANAVALGD
jgi:methyl-accepting chemotaxis protein